MIHILTLHYVTPAWLEIQKRHILKYTNTEDYKVWLGKYKLDIPDDFEIPSNWEMIDLDKVYPPELGNEHVFQMEWMYDECVKDKMDSQDIIVFMDNDAFPCDPAWIDILQESLVVENRQGICVIDRGNRGIAQPDEYWPLPDLCFFGTTKSARSEYDLKFGIFHPTHQNPGMGMLDRMKVAHQNGARWGILERTNIFNSHKVMFGVYGGMIYHQGAGTRGIVGRPFATGGVAPSSIEIVPDNFTEEEKACDIFVHSDPDQPWEYRGATPSVTRQCYSGIDLLDRWQLGNWLPDSGEEFEEECEDIIEVNTQIFDIIYKALVSDTDCKFVRRYFLGIP